MPVTLIKPVLILAILALAMWAFRHRRRVAMRAGVKVLVIALTLSGVAAVGDPNLTQQAANWVGVKYGVDLLVYILVIVFAFTQAGTYFHFKEIEQRLAQVVRAQALADAFSAKPRANQVTSEHTVEVDRFVSGKHFDPKLGEASTSTAGPSETNEAAGRSVGPSSVTVPRCACAVSEDSTPERLSANACSEPGQRVPRVCLSRDDGPTAT